MKSTRDFERLAKALGGIPIWGCLPGSASARAGVRYGDVLLSVNGVPTPTIDAYLAARQSTKSTLTVVVFRDGAELTLKLRLPRRKAEAEDDAAMEKAVRQVIEGRMVPVSRGKKRSKADPS
ncbi:MAG: PDZ domain-containing protein [Polyangiaceae bacterium]